MSKARAVPAQLIWQLLHPLRWPLLFAVIFDASRVAAAPAGLGASLLEKYQCHRCHEGTGLPPVAADKHCVNCHQTILRGELKAPAEALERWRGHIKSLTAIPSLVAIDRRLRRDFVEAYLLKPFDLRPNLVAMMPRLALSPEEARALAQHLVPRADEAPDAARDSGEDRDAVARGQALFQRMSCATCHRFTGASGSALPAGPLPVSLSPEKLTLSILLAPDLRHTRVRMASGALRRWLADPGSVKPDAAMPRMPLSPEEIRALATYITRAPLAPEVLPASPRLPRLARRVAFDEVNERVFRRTCWHCHSTPEYAMGDGGAGNTGGFGFRGRGLNLSDYISVSSGSLDDQGQRRSVFRPLADGTPHLLAHLLARQREMAGEIVPGIRGMPLGLPALSPEQIQLVESWIAQGRPR